jgi:hypothetical protein
MDIQITFRDGPIEAEIVADEEEDYERCSRAWQSSQTTTICRVRQTATLMNSHL